MAAIGNIGGTPASAGSSVRQMAVAKAANFGPGPGTTGSNKPNIQSELERQNNHQIEAEKREARQDRRERQQKEARSGVYGGANSGGRKSGTGAQGKPGYGSNRNYPQTV